MTSILFNTFIYLIIIGLGFLLKKTRVLPENSGDIIATLVIKVTLPAMLLYSSDGIVMSSSIAVLIAIGIAVNLVILAVCLILFKKESPLCKSVMMLSSAGVDVGNFVMPFILTFFPGEGVIALSAFNIGNTIMIQGFNYVIASKVAASGNRFGIRDAVKRLLSSVAFDSYLVILFLACTKLRLPTPVMDIIKVGANANIFLVMIMIGLKLEFRFAAGEKTQVLKVMALRILGGAVLAALTWCLPISRVAKIVISAAYFGPPSSVSTVYSRNLGHKGSLSSQVYVFCIFTGMILITAVMMIFPESWY